VKWFGAPWNPNCCEPEALVRTPVGETCAYFRCKQPIVADDQGFLIPVFNQEGDGQPWHADCFVRSISPCPGCENCQPPAVHILRAGWPLCGFSKELPENWPKGHKWVRETEASGKGSCRGCVERRAVA